MDINAASTHITWLSSRCGDCSVCIPPVARSRICNSAWADNTRHGDHRATLHHGAKVGLRQPPVPPCVRIMLPMEDQVPHRRCNSERRQMEPVRPSRPGMVTEPGARQCRYRCICCSHTEEYILPYPRHFSVSSVKANSVLPMRLMLLVYPCRVPFCSRHERSAGAH